MHLDSSLQYGQGVLYGRKPNIGRRISRPKANLRLGTHAFGFHFNIFNCYIETVQHHSVIKLILVRRFVPCTNYFLHQLVDSDNKALIFKSTKHLVLYFYKFFSISSNALRKSREDSQEDKVLLVMYVDCLLSSRRQKVVSKVHEESLCWHLYNKTVRKRKEEIFFYYSVSSKITVSSVVYHIAYQT